MTEITLTSYLVAGTLAISGAFGSQDAALKQEVLTRTARQIAQFGGGQGRDRVADGLDRILASKEIERYHWHVALATEMLFATFGRPPARSATLTLPGFTEDFIAPLEALNLASLARAMTVLAYGQEVALPVPIRKWDDVTGQYFFDRAKRQVALAELDAIGDIKTAVAALKTRQPDAFKDCDPEDLVSLLTRLREVLSQAEAEDAEIAIFRHGGV